MSKNKFTVAIIGVGGRGGYAYGTLIAQLPEQFEIVGLGISNSGIEIGVKPYLPEHKKYRKEVQHKGAVDGDLYFLDEEEHPQVPYARIIIRRKTNEN